MAITLTGPIKELGELQQGQSRAGKDWRKREVVIQHESGQYPKEVSITAMNAACDALDQFSEGDEIVCECSIESKPHNGRRFTNVNAFKVSRP